MFNGKQTVVTRHEDTEQNLLRDLSKAKVSVDALIMLSVQVSPVTLWQPGSVPAVRLEHCIYAATLI